MPEILKNRKTGLVASKNFKEGETIYTEVALVVNDTYLDQENATVNTVIKFFNVSSSFLINV